MPPISTDALPEPAGPTLTEEEVAAQRNANVAQNLAGLDALELADRPARGEWLQRAWSLTWPKVAAIAIALSIWQIVVWSGWKPEYVLPSPATAFKALWDGITDGTLLWATWYTLQRAIVGFALAIGVGVVIGGLCSQFKVLRIAIGSMITGLQTMPSIAWLPLAILLFQLTEGAILFVIVIGAAPSIANGLLSGRDNIPPILTRAGRVLGASGWSMFRSVTLPASLPSFVAGLKQGWAFAWRSLMAGELLVIIADKPSIGFQLQQARTLADAPELLAVMILILIIGIVVDSLFFGKIEKAVRKRWGLIDTSTA